MPRLTRSDMTPEELAEIERNDRIEAIMRWSFTAFVAAVLVGWLLWSWAR
jgi:hypothetical protein